MIFYLVSMKNYLIISTDLSFVYKFSQSFHFRMILVPIKTNTTVSLFIRLLWRLKFPFRKMIFFDFNQLEVLEQYLLRYDIDSCIVYSMPYLLPKEALNLFRGVKINIHPSALPKFRGPNPVIHQILSNEDIYITVHEIDSGEDTGDILASSKVTMNNVDSYKNIDNLVINAAIEILVRLMSSIKTAPRIKQDLTIKRKRAKRLTEEQIVNLLETKSFENEVVIKLLTYQPHLIKGLIQKINYSFIFNYAIDPQSTSPSFFVIPSGVFHYRRRISFSKLLKSLIKAILNQ